MDRHVARLLKKSGLLKAEEIDAALAKAEEAKRPLCELLLMEYGVGEESLADAFAGQLHTERLRMAAVAVDPEVLKFVPEAVAKKHLCLPIRVEAECRVTDTASGRRPQLLLAMANPADLLAIQDVEFACGHKVRPLVATFTEMKAAIARYYASDAEVSEILQNVEPAPSAPVLAPDDDEEEEQRQSPAVKMANTILQHGIREKASDIHIEPGVQEVTVRTRREGMLHEYIKIPKWMQDAVVSRFKIMAKMDISEKRRPQDGRIKVTFEDRDVDLRVSTLPTNFGEKVVLRILGSGERVPPTPSLGLRPEDLVILKRAADQPQGLVLVTGPTGSGKTTTLYSLLNEKLNPTINIITVEDPIEIELEGINQVQVNNKAGLTFATTLRSILRQDPDVILVGEIRDLETAEIAFHAAMTGHMVFSTLHTNSTLATITRLLDLGVDPFLIGSSLNLVVAQRLLRRNCEKCKEVYLPGERTLEVLRLARTEHKFYRGRGCDACGRTGFAGRQGVYEILRITPTVKELISRKASEAELRKAALNAGTVFLPDAALDMVRAGTTSPEEVLRVVQMVEDEARSCPNCGSMVRPEFTTCPNCLFVLRAVCEECGKDLNAEWKICPYCNSPRKPAFAAAEALSSPGGGMEAAAAPAAVAVAAAPTPQMQAGTGNGHDPTKRPRIVVVDDDATFRRMVVKTLERLPNHPEILEACDGVSGVATVQQANPDLVVLDVMMPGMNGFEVCQKLRGSVQTAFIPILMLTAETDDESRTKGFLGGIDDYMAKPISVPELHARVGRLLRRNYGI